MVCAAIAYIEEHLTTLTGLDEICRGLYITKSHLHHLFTEHLQITPKKFIVSKRLALAQREICSGGRPTEVCRRCGFADYSSFWRAYTAHYGRRPSEKPVDEREENDADRRPRRTPDG
jgi:AraC-like DNA-binding protein